MILYAHIAIAVAGIITSTLAFVKVSQNFIKATFGLVILTFLSGALLVGARHADMMQACISGLFYIGLVSSGIAGAYYRLAKETIKK